MVKRHFVRKNAVWGLIHVKLLLIYRIHEDETLKWRQGAEKCPVPIHRVSRGSTNESTRQKKTKKTQKKQSEREAEHLDTVNKYFFFYSSSCYNSSSMWFSGWVLSSFPGKKDRDRNHKYAKQ